ncbi:helix-hairpin-helix domain-containing protein [Streptomyces sp. NPDC001691]|uniref:helix-hairpin-helix domain-containing protein n=1 Tax=Streptomyces sp. NPDC001691 TaxID=3364600 RepID=UPI0036B2A7B3
MAIRSRRTPTSGPGRAPGSDGRARAGRARGRLDQVPASGSAARSRGDALFLPPPPGTAAPPHEPVAATVRALGQSALAPPGEPERAVAATPAAPKEFRGSTAAAPRATFVSPAASAGPGRPAVEPRPVVTAQPSSLDGAGPGVRERTWAAVRERLPLWAQTRFGLAPRSLAALCVVLVVAAGFAVHHFWAGRPQSVRAPELVDGPAPPFPGAKNAKGAGHGPGRGASGEPTPQPVANAAPSPTGVLVVDVGGKVQRPGVYRLPAGSRVADALTAAGGVRDGADLTGLNRARLLTDGEQVLAGVGGAAPAGPGAGGGTPGTPSGPVSLNSASVEQLDGLPGVGPVLAQHIVDYRTQHGGFRSVDELREVNGIGERRFNDLQPLVRL